MSRIEWLTHDDFAGRVGDRFALSVPDGSSLAVELVEVTESAELGGVGPDGQVRHQFSLVFRGPPEPAMAQSIYQLDHEDLGELELFLVPIGPDADGMRYEAIFT